MATIPVSTDRAVPRGRTLMSYEEAMKKLSEDQAFRATIYAMNSLLIQKGVYSPEEFEFQVRQYAQYKAR